MQPSKFGQSIADYMANAIQLAFAPATPAEPTFQIFVKDLQGKTITINDVKSSDLLQVVFEKIVQRLDASPDEVRFSFAGKPLDINSPNLPLSDYGIRSQSTLEELKRLRGGVGEYAALQEFMTRNIVHGNVTGLRTPKSLVGVSVGRNAGYFQHLIHKPEDYQEKIISQLNDIIKLNNIITRYKTNIKALYQEALKYEHEITTLESEKVLLMSELTTHARTMPTEEAKEMANTINNKINTIEGYQIELTKVSSQLLLQTRELDAAQHKRDQCYNNADGLTKSLYSLRDYNDIGTAISDDVEEISINDVYASNPRLVHLYKKSIITQALNSGNCDEMAKLVAVRLIETTQNQWVYVCAYTGNYPLDMSQNAKEGYPVEEKYRSTQTRADFDHVFVITYPTDCELASMNEQEATVIDAWYNHLICSLADYRTKLHPYYNYEFSSDKNYEHPLAKFKIIEHYQAVGEPFAKDKTEETEAFAEIEKQKSAIKEKAKKYSRLQDTPFEFDVDTSQLRDARSLENLEYLLLNANTQGKSLWASAASDLSATGAAISEVELFTPATFATILQSTNPDVLMVLYQALAMADPTILKAFAQVATPQQLAQCFLLPDKAFIYYYWIKINQIPTERLAALHTISNIQLNDLIMVGNTQEFQALLAEDAKHLEMWIEQDIEALVTRVDELTEAQLIVFIQKATATQLQKVLTETRYEKWCTIDALSVEEQTKLREQLPAELQKKYEVEKR